MAERTFILIKPDHVALADKILSEMDGKLEDIAERKATAHIPAVPRAVIEEHYAVHHGKPFYQYLVDSFVGNSVVASVYAGVGVVQRVIDLCGPTDPAQAAANTIRGRYSADSLEKAIAEHRPVCNVIHRSDSAAEAEREIAVWNDYLRIT